MEEGRHSDLATAAGSVPDGALVYLGGSVLSRKPLAFVRALIDAGRRDLRVISFTGSLDVDLLCRAGAVRSVAAAYVGLGPHGRATHFQHAVSAREIEDREYTEWTLLGRLRAAAMGVPFLPTRGGLGSGVVADRELETIVDPYSGDRFLALAPLRPEVTVLHALRADPTGNVQLSSPPEHLWDVDVLAARAADRVIVTVEAVEPESVIAASPELTRLFGFEVDLVVEAPFGARPTASPPRYGVDHAALDRYAAAGGDPAALEAAA